MQLNFLFRVLQALSSCAETSGASLRRGSVTGTGTAPTTRTRATVSRSRVLRGSLPVAPAKTSVFSGMVMMFFFWDLVFGLTHSTRCAQIARDSMSERPDSGRLE